MKTCRNCGKQYESKIITSLYCSGTCRNTYKIREKRRRQQPAVTCVSCGGHFLRSRGQSNLTLCPSCRAKRDADKLKPPREKRVLEVKRKFCKCGQEISNKRTFCENCSSLSRKMSWAKVRSKRMELPSTLTLAEWEEALIFFENKCAYCGEELHSPQREHFVPCAKGGHLSKDNIVPACSKCNTSKGKKNAIDWLVNKEHGLLSFVKVSLFLEGRK